MADWITVAAIVIAPIPAIVISIAFDVLRKRREQKLFVLRILMSARLTPSDPSYSAAMNLVPVEFSGHRPVLVAFREFLVEANKSGLPNAPENPHLPVKLAALIHAMMQASGIKGIRESDVLTQGYQSLGAARRDELYIDSLKALREIADNAKLQSSLFGMLVQNQSGSESPQQE